MTGKAELTVFLVAAFATLIGLTTVQEFYLSHLDISEHTRIAAAPANSARLETRRAEASALASAPVPIGDAKRALAERGRLAFPDIAPTASEDYSALSGWVHAPDFKPFVPPAPPAVLDAAATETPTDSAEPTAPVAE